MHVLEAYAQFLRSSCVSELGEEYLRLLGHRDSTFLERFGQLRPERLARLATESLDALLQGLEAGRALDGLVGSLRAWEDAAGAGQELGHRDLQLIHMAQKQALQGFVARFTSDVATAMQIVKELEEDVDTRLAARIGERKRAEEQRLEFELFVASVTEYAIIMLDTQGIIRTWNKGAERIKGYRADEIKGRSFAELYTAEDQARGKPARALETARRDGLFREEALRVRKDGTTFWADVTITALRDGQGRLVGYGKVTQDVTARKHAEEQRRAFELLVKGVVDYAIFMLDPEGHVATWNEGAQRIKGYAPAEIIGKPYATFFVPEDVAAGRPRQLLDRARAEGHVEDLGWRARKDGSRFWADAIITALHDEQGRFVGYGKVTRDLTERKLAEEQARQLLALRDTEQLKDQFLSILSHELRTPINAIMGFGSILEDELAGPLTETQHGYLRKMLSGADLLLSLVSDLLDMSRIQAGRFALAPQSMRFEEVAEGVVATLLPLAEIRRQRLACRIAHPLPPIVADAQRVSQVLINLVGNAIKYTPDGGTITVDAAVADGELRCEVKDDGEGIAAADLPKLFLPFTQVDTSNTRKAGGVGLGLSIAKALVEAHRGRIGVVSEPGVGSTFWFTLPLDASEEPADLSEAERQ